MDGSGPDWNAYAAIMGRASNRDLIWGSYDDGGDTDVIGWAFSGRGDTGWLIEDEHVGINDVPNADSEFPEFADMNIWAYQRSSAIPSPHPSYCWASRASDW